MRAFRVFLWIIRGVWIILVGIIALLIAGYIYYFHIAPFSMRKAVREEVVARLRKQDLTPEQETLFKLDDLSDAKSLHPLAPDQNSRGSFGVIWALRERDGALKVAIATADWGHAGGAGFIYSDTPLPADTEKDEWDVGPAILNKVTPVDDHWWKVYWSD